MGRGKQLSPSEIAHVLQLKERNFKISQIAKTIERSRTVIESLLKDPLNYGLSKKAKKRNIESALANAENQMAVDDAIQLIGLTDVAGNDIVVQLKQKKLLGSSTSPTKDTIVKHNLLKQNGMAKKEKKPKVIKEKTIKDKVTKNKTKKLNKAKNTIKFKMSFNRKKKSGKNLHVKLL